MIRPDPQNTHIKFLIEKIGSENNGEFYGNGYGLLVAVNDDEHTGIVLATGSTEEEQAMLERKNFEGSKVERGQLCLVREIDETHHPNFVKIVDCVPNDPQKWKILYHPNGLI